MKSMLMVLSLNLFLLSSLVMAEEPSPTMDNSLSEDEVVEKVLQSNYELQSIKTDIEIAQAELQKAGLWPNPEVEYSFVTDKYNANEGEESSEYGLSQSIPISGRTIFQKKVAKLGIERAKWQVKNFERELIAETLKTFYQIAVLEEKEKIFSFLVKINEDLLETVKSRLNQGEVSEVDVSITGAELQTTRQKLAEIKALLFEKKSTLNRLMGQRVNHSYSVRPDSLEPEFADLDLDALTEKTLENRPDIKAKAIEVKMGEGSLRLARAMQIPDITLGGFYTNETSFLDVNDQIIEDKGKLIGAKISLPFPLFNRNQGEISQAKAEKKKVNLELEALKIQAMQEVAFYYTKVISNKGILDSFQRGILQTAEKSVTLIQEAYSQGQISIFDVVQTQDKFGNIRESYLDAIQNSRESIIGLESAVGGYLLKEKMKEGGQLEKE